MRFLDQIREHKVRFLKTIVQQTTYITMGLLSSMVGPCLLDLRQQVSTSLTMISYTLSARAAGHAIGSVISKSFGSVGLDDEMLTSASFLCPIICARSIFSIHATVGLVYSKVNFQVTSFCFMFVSTALTIYVPFIRQVEVLLAVFVLNQLSMGAFEAGSNMFILHLWGKEVTPFMQTLHFAFGVGSLLAPVIAVPFLFESDADVVSSNMTTVTPILKEVFHPEDISLHWPYNIIAACLFANAIFGLIVWFLYPETTPHPSRESQSQEGLEMTDKQRTEDGGDMKRREDGGETSANHCQEPQASAPKPFYKIWKAIVCILTVIFMHIYMGLEIGFGSYTTTFAVKSDLNLSKTDGAHLTTMYWATFTVFRITTIFYLDRIGQELNIFLSLMVILIAHAFLVPFGNSNITMLWIGVALIGTGVSSIWACVFGFLEEHFTISPLFSSIMIVSAVVGEFVFPAIISYFIDGFPMILMWTSLVCVATISILFAIISLICRFKLGKLTT